MAYHKARKDYDNHILLEANCPEHPHLLLDHWLTEAYAISKDANAMVLSTVNESNRPSSRVVLLRELSEKGISFYTNYNSRKGVELIDNDNVALNFFWPELERQVRLEGRATKHSKEVSDIYFASRPRESQIGAWASAQSKIIGSRDTLDERTQEFQSKFKGAPVPRPPFWGGYLVSVHYYEFWQGRPSRLHDRIEYARVDGNWVKCRLAP